MIFNYSLILVIEDASICSNPSDSLALKGSDVNLVRSHIFSLTLKKNKTGTTINVKNVATNKP